MNVIRTLQTATTLDQVADLSRSEAWAAALRDLAKRGEAAQEEIERLRGAVNEAKQRLSPEHNHAELQELKRRVYEAASDPEAARPLLKRIAALREALPLRWHERLFGGLETALGQLFSPLLSGTGYSNRARRARDLFTEHAGRTKIEGAATDKHGNAAGTGYDLGRDGAFEGHAVHVLHLYTGEGFDFSLPTAAFRRKGFRVERRTTPGSPAELRRWLSEARQLWLISNSSALLTQEHIKVIQEFWASGGALYLWGDNQPYYVDANNILATLFGPEAKMTGNLMGGKVVRELSPDRKGFHAHLVTTGLVHLYEGITVASFQEDAVARHGFAPLLYGSAGNLITIVRDPTSTHGAVMADTAFTRLFVQWDEAGSARYVCNAACFLAAMTLAEEPAEEEAAPAPTEEEKNAPLLVATGALAGVCDLTAEPSPTWLVLSIAELGDALRNTGDFVLTDPLAFGAQNRIFSEQVYGEQMGQWILSQGKDPFTQRPVVGCLPLVDLSHKQNLRELTLLLCKYLLGGKYLPTAARLLFFAVVDQMHDPARRTDHPEAWEFLYRQCLAHFTSTPEFSDLGQPMPLLDAMAAYFSPATEEAVQLRRSFTTVGVIGRTLLREKRATPARVRAIARRSLLKTLVGDALIAEKAAPGTVRPAIEEMLYRTFFGIPVLNSGRVPEEWPSFFRDQHAARERLERALGAPLLTAEERAVVLRALLPLDLRQFSAESAITLLQEKDPAFRAVWRGEDPGDVVALLNQRFAAYQKGIHAEDPHLKVPPFVTTYGPSVFRCLCGERFGDPSKPLTAEALLALTKARTAHFKSVYRARGEGWYPNEGTLHYNLHRAVQRVVASQFTDATAVVPAMIGAVAAYLKDDAKGYLCDPLLKESILVALESYLALRAAGQPHPEGLLTIQRKAEFELL